MNNVRSITDDVFKNPLTPIPVACAVITVVVIGVLALLEVGPFASFAYSDVVACCSFAFTGLLILCIAAVKGCIISPIAVKELPKEIQSSSDTVKQVAVQPGAVNQVSVVNHDDTSIVRGRISIKNYLNAGALGKDTPRLFYPSSEVKRVDGIDWKAFPNEMLIECELFNIQGRTQLTSLFLPFCLFVNNDDYGQWKKEGEIVTFLFEGQCYELIIDQAESTLPNMSLNEMITRCEEIFYRNKGHSILFQDAKGKDETSYLSPMDVQKHRNALAEGEQLKQEFKEKFSEVENPPPFELPAKPKCTIYNYEDHTHLKYEIPGITQDSIRCFMSEISYAIYASKTDQIPPERMLMHPKGIEIKAKDCRDLYKNEFLIIIDFDDTFTRKRLEDVKMKVKNGLLHLTLMV